MTHFDRVAIVGVGLIGGSIGLALLRRNLAKEVVGIGRSKQRLKIAERNGIGAVTSTTTDLPEGVAEADPVVVCTPVDRIVEDVRRVAGHCPPGTLITDAGSTKRPIVEALDAGLPRDCRFLGSHPIAGSEKSGVEHADPDLFVDKPAVITPTENSRPEDIARLTAFWEGLGAKVCPLSPEQHDEILARTSHMPHVVAAALAGVIPRAQLCYAGTGLASTTRIAGASVGLWNPILLQNRANVVAALEEFEQELATLRTSIQRGDAGEMERILGLARENVEALEEELLSSKKDHHALGS